MNEVEVQVRPGAGGVTARTVMRRNVLTVGATDSLSAVWAAMRATGCGIAVVTAGDACLGVVGEQELTLAWGLELIPARCRRVVSFVRPAPTVPASTHLPELCDVLLRSRVGTAIVVDEQQRLIGLVTVDDVIAAIADAAEPAAS